MFTAGQLVAHAVGDYLLQSHWMATEKTRRSVACAAHVATYVLPFLFLTRDWRALTVIAATHFVIDRWRLARYVVWAKNCMAPWRRRVTTISGLDSEVTSAGVFWKPIGSRTDTRWVCPAGPMPRSASATGYGTDVPDWLAVWLFIIADNVLHVLCNGVALWVFS